MIGINPKNSENGPGNGPGYGSGSGQNNWPANGSSRVEENGRRMVSMGASIGALLRERREALGASLAEVEAATKIRQKYLSALEADEWQLLPGEVVGRGFLRNYASYLGLEPTDIIDRRRAIADPSLAGALAPTSAGSALPPLREVDYRPKDVGLREEPQSLEERQPPKLGPLFAVIGALAVLILFWWGLSRFGGSMLDGVTTSASDMGDRVAGFFGGDDEPTPLPNSLAVLTTPGAADAVGAEPTSTSVFGALPAQETTSPETSAASGQETVQEPAAAPIVIPTSTPQLEVPAATLAPVEPTATLAPPTSTPLPSSVNTAANLRSAPNTEGTVVGAANPGDLVNIRGQSADSQWYLLDSGAWIFAELVTNPPAAAPVVDPSNVEAAVALLPTATAVVGQEGAIGALPTATPADAAAALPTETPTEIPTAVPEPVVVQAACADPRAQITSPGQGQIVSGIVNIAGVATHEIFQSFKVEAGPSDGVLAFIGSGNAPVEGGGLSSLNTANFPNGNLLIRLTVVDQTGNFPPPCDVTVTVQN